MTGFAQSMIDAMARVARREIRDARMATAGWGTVTSATPLAVVLDEGSGAPMTATPAPLVAGLASGDRVWVEIAGNRAVIVGRAGGPSPTAPAPTGLSTTADWSIVTGFDNHARLGHLVLVSYRLTYNGVGINVPATGDIANSHIGVMPAALRPPIDTPLSSGWTGRTASFVLGSNGNLTLTAVGGSANIDTGAVFSCGGTYLASGVL